MKKALTLLLLTFCALVDARGGGGGHAGGGGRGFDGGGRGFDGAGRGPGGDYRGPDRPIQRTPSLNRNYIGGVGDIGVPAINDEYYYPATPYYPDQQQNQQPSQQSQ